MVGSDFAHDYGFVTLRLSDDWQGADFIAQHIDGRRFIKIQLKSRSAFAKKYHGKKLFIGGVTSWSTLIGFDRKR